MFQSRTRLTWFRILTRLTPPHPTAPIPHQSFELRKESFSKKNELNVAVYYVIRFSSMVVPMTCA